MYNVSGVRNVVLAIQKLRTRSYSQGWKEIYTYYEKMSDLENECAYDHYESCSEVKNDIFIVKPLLRHNQLIPNVIYTVECANHFYEGREVLVLDAISILKPETYGYNFNEAMFVSYRDEKVVTVNPRIIEFSNGCNMCFCKEECTECLCDDSFYEPSCECLKECRVVVADLEKCLESCEIILDEHYNNSRVDSYETEPSTSSDTYETDDDQSSERSAETDYFWSYNPAFVPPSRIPYRTTNDDRLFLRSTNYHNPFSDIDWDEDSVEFQTHSL